MTVKKKYRIDDIVWIYGITRSHNKLHRGKVIHTFTLEHAGYNDEPHYVIAIPNEIEPLLEVRTWHNISQDDHGPVGCFRHEVPEEEMQAVDKKLSQLGLTIEEYDRFEEAMAEDDEINPEVIHAAMERASKSSMIPPLNLNEPKPKRRHYPRKKKV